MIIWLFFLYFMENSTTYWADNQTWVQPTWELGFQFKKKNQFLWESILTPGFSPHGNSGFSFLKKISSYDNRFLLLENLGISFQSNFHQMRYMIVFNLIIKSKTKMRLGPLVRTAQHWLLLQLQHCISSTLQCNDDDGCFHYGSK